MKTFKVGMCLSICIVILIGCSNKTIQNKPIYQKSTEVKMMIDQKDWNRARNGAEQINHLFKNNKWKYQLLGDETEFSGLENEIKKLQISLEEKDKKEAKQNLAMIKSYMESLYFK